MTTSKSACCEKCRVDKLLDSEGEMDIPLSVSICSNAACKCHKELCHPPSQIFTGFGDSVPTPENQDQVSFIPSQPSAEAFMEAFSNITGAKFVDVTPSQPAESEYEKRNRMINESNIEKNNEKDSVIMEMYQGNSEDWEKEFDREFDVRNLAHPKSDQWIAKVESEPIKSFIRSEREKARAEGKEEGQREAYEDAKHRILRYSAHIEKSVLARILAIFPESK